MLSYWPLGNYIVNFAENHVDLHYSVIFVENSVDIVHGKGNDGVCLDVVGGKVLDRADSPSVMLLLSDL